MTTPKVPPRNEIPIEYTWNSTSVFPNHEAWEKERKSIIDSLPEISQFQGRLKESPSILADAFEAGDNLRKRTLIVAMYAFLSHEVDKGDQKCAMMAGKAQSLFGQVIAAVAFFEPELISIGLETLHEWIKVEPRLKIFTHYIENLFRQQAHVRTQEVEEILGMLADPFSSTATTAGMLTDADLKFTPAITSTGEELEVTQGSYPKILTNPDRQARRSAWESYADAHLAFKNTLANNLTTSIKQNVFTCRARRHTNTLEASLFANNIPTEVFHNLLETFRKNLPIWQQYFALRARALGVNDLQHFDMWAPLTAERPKVTFQQAVEWICAGLEPMGKEYVETIRKGCLEQRWVDIYPNQGKNSGAFSYGAQGTFPFIVMNFNDDVFSLSTLAHELGHSMHSYLTWKTQPPIYSDYSLFVAEVASNFHQAMVRAYLLEHNQEVNFQIALIEEAMANFFRYFFIMPTLARFELEVHQRVERGEGLSADSMNDLLADLFQESYGDAVKIDRPRYGIIWSEFSHMYADYYVYQYATGISGAHALSHRILSGVPGAVESYLNFLKAGSSMYPLEVLKMAGVDLTSPQPVEATFAILKIYVERLDSLL